MNKQEKELLNGLQIGLYNEIITNPFSKVEVDLCPEAVALYDFLRGCEITGDIDSFYMAREVFRKNWPDEFMLLVD